MARRSTRQPRPTKPRPRQPDRRERLLDVAIRQFSVHGFAGASVRSICGEAGANIAAVKYYFGDKQGLYAAALQRAVHTLMAARPMPRLGGEDDPERALARWVRWGVEFVIEGGPTRVALTRIILREVREPTPVFRALFKSMGEPVTHDLRALIAAVAARRGASPDVTRITACVMLLTTQYEHSAEFMEQLGLPTPRTSAELDALAAIITDMALGAIVPGRRS